MNLKSLRPTRDNLYVEPLVEEEPEPVPVEKGEPIVKAEVV